MSKFKIGDKVVLTDGKLWSGGEDCKVVESVEIDEFKRICYKLSNSVFNWYGHELELYSPTKVDLLKDTRGEYIKLKTEIEDKKINMEFYINEFKYEEEFCCEGKATFNVRHLDIKDIKKKMTKAEMERALGYKIEIVED